MGLSLFVSLIPKRAVSRASAPSVHAKNLFVDSQLVLASMMRTAIPLVSPCLRLPHLSEHITALDSVNAKDRNNTHIQSISIVHIYATFFQTYMKNKKY
jgi:hypothetical protein